MKYLIAAIVGTVFVIGLLTLFSNIAHREQWETHEGDFVPAEEGTFDIGQSAIGELILTTNEDYSKIILHKPYFTAIDTIQEDEEKIIITFLIEEKKDE